MPQPRRMHLAVQQRVVDRMEHAIADAGHHREADEGPVARAEREAERRDRQQAQAAEKDRPRPVAVDDEPRQRLHRARDHEEDRHQQAELGIAHAERVLQPGKERRQQELAEVADAVREPHQADDGRVLAHDEDGRHERHGRITIACQLLSRSCQ